MAAIVKKLRRAIAASDYMRLPVDVPVEFTLHRLVEPVGSMDKPVMGLAGWTLELAVRQGGPTFYLRVGFPKRTIQVFIRETPDSPARVLWQDRP